MSSEKRRPFCLGLNVLMCNAWIRWFYVLYLEHEIFYFGGPHLCPQLLNQTVALYHENDITWKHLPHHWSFVRESIGPLTRWSFDIFLAVRINMFWTNSGVSDNLVRLDTHMTTLRYAWWPFQRRPVPWRDQKSVPTIPFLFGCLWRNHYNIKYDNYSGVLTTDIIDHFPVFHVSKLHCDHPIDKEYKTIRIINEHRKLKFMEKIQNMDWTSLDSFQDCQTYFSNFLELFKNTYDESFPTTRVKIKYRYRLPWLSDGLKSSIRQKNKLYRISLKHYS